MESRKYSVSRDNVYVGEVVETDRIYRYEGDTNLFRTKPGQLSTGSWFSYRSILFVPNEERLSNDLLYRSPNYPILNVTDDDTCLSLGEKSIVIKDACNLAALLEYFKYSKDLTYQDIIRIKKTFLNGSFAMDNCELFGYKETKPEDYIYCENGVEITDIKELKRRISQQKQTGSRSFSGISESILPEEYWDVLNNHTIDSFNPHKQEGAIRKLTRF